MEPLTAPQNDSTGALPVSQTGFAPVQKLVLIPQTATPAEQFALWREGVAPVLEVRPCATPAAYAADVTAYLLGDMVLNRNVIAPSIYRRGAQQRTNEATDYMVLQYFVRGEEHLITPHGSVTMCAPNIYLRDWGHEFSSRSSHCDQFGIVIPRRLLRISDWTYEHASTLCWPANSPTGSLLAGAIENLWRILPTAKAGDIPKLGAGFLGMLNGLLSGPETPLESSSVQSALLHAARRYIQQHLQDPRLDAAHLCKTFHCSRATLYRAFEPSGGVQGYIRDQRLERCRRAFELQGPAQGGGAVRRVAEEWGFDEPSSFTRLFKRTYGLTPSDLVRRAAFTAEVPGTAAMSSATLLQMWLTAL